MKKIISLFRRNYETDWLVRAEVVPGAEWVLAGEGVATRKFDGTCCLVRDGKLYKRYEIKPGARPPVNFESASEADGATGKQQGWVPIGDGPEDRWHREAWDNQIAPADDWTYELCGPKVQGNAEREYVEKEVGPNRHLLIPHGYYLLCDVPRSFDSIRDYLRTHPVEGIVWWRQQGDLGCDKVKIKARDFGIKRWLAAK